MEYISVSQFAAAHNIAERTVRHWCTCGKIDGTFITGKTWNIPFNAKTPEKSNDVNHVSPLLKRLREEKQASLKGGIYHRTQIDLTYNSNHIEGSRLSHEQTRYIFETNTIGASDEAVKVDDIVETVNHFRCIDMIIDRAQERITVKLIKELHKTLKTGTTDSKLDWFRVGDYKMMPNEVGGKPTSPPGGKYTNEADNNGIQQLHEQAIRRHT